MRLVRPGTVTTRDESPSSTAYRAAEVRRRAADLALIGLAIQEGGIDGQRKVVVELDVFWVVSALQAAAELEVRRYVRGDDR